MLEAMSADGAEVKAPDVSQSPKAPSVDMEPANAIDPAIQKRTILKVDTVILGCFGIMYLLANLDRNNLVSMAEFPPPVVDGS
jgi:hypothetical protein